MSWLRSSPLRQSLTRNGSNSGSSNSNTPFFSSTNSTSMSLLRQRPIDSATDCDPRACYDSFCKHWQQAYDIIQRSDLPYKPPTHDDVLGVVSHLDFMVTLLLVELHHCNKIQLPTNEATPPAPCLEYMLSENLLDKLYEWGCTTGRYANAVRLEQLKLYELLVSHSRHQLLCHEPFLRPLLKILASSQDEIFPPDLEKRLVILLNQLCVVLMQNVHLLDLFFFTAQTQEQQNSNELTRCGTMSNFIIFSLLIPYVHREGSLGHQARDALLLCMALSQKNSNVGTYIAQYSSMCPLLVTGLGGLYSRLPNSIEITSIDWHRITPDDVTEIPELTLFMNALEFCNAVVQVAHEMIKQQLLDFLYQGFIVPVLGPAILQTNIDSQISTMSYLDLMLRSITEPSLLRLFIKFLLDAEKFDGERILDSLIERLGSSDANLCMVTMALFDTLLGLHCEDLMLELLLKYLLPAKHVPISYRHKINKIDPYTNTAEYFLDLTPDVMKRARELTKHKNVSETVAQQQPLQQNHQQQQQQQQSQLQQQHTNMPTLPSPTSTMSKTIGANWNYYGLHTGESLYANFHAYLFDAHWRIAQCQSACSKWANCYKYQKWPARGMRQYNAQALEMAKQFFNEFSLSPLSNFGCVLEHDIGDKKQLDSLQSLGESSGYESFKWRPADDDSEHNNDVQNSTACSESSTATAPNELFDISSSSKLMHKKDAWRISSNRTDLLFTELDFSEDLFAQGTVTLGPFVNAIWRKLQTFTSNTLYVNLHLTGLITRLAWFPLPLIHSILLRPDIVITSDTPSFLQMLRILKQQIDAELPVIEDSLEIIDIARSHLIDREFRLINARKAGENSPLHLSKAHSTTTTLTSAALTAQQRNNQVQVTPSSSYDPFRRNEIERKSIRKSITNMFRSKPNASSGLSQIKAFFTGAASTLANSMNNAQLATAAAAAAATTTIQTQTASTNAMQTRETSLITTPAATIKATTTTNNQTATTTINENNERLANATTTIIPTTTTTATAVASSAASKTNLTGSTTTLTSQSNASISTLIPTSTTGGGNSEPVSLESLSSMGAIAHTSGTERTRDVALCAVLLDEWLKELAAIAQEQSVVLINDNLLKA